MTLSRFEGKYGLVGLSLQGLEMIQHSSADGLRLRQRFIQPHAERTHAGAILFVLARVLCHLDPVSEGTNGGWGPCRSPWLLR